MVENQLTVLLHNGEDLDNDLGGRSDEDLSLSSSLGVDDVVLQDPVSNLILLTLPSPISFPPRTISLIGDIAPNSKFHLYPVPLPLTSRVYDRNTHKGVVKNGDSDHLDSFFEVFYAEKRGLSGN